MATGPRWHHIRVLNISDQCIERPQAKHGDNHLCDEQGVYCPPLLTPPWENGVVAKGDARGKALEVVLPAWWPTWGDPAFVILA